MPRIRSIKPGFFRSEDVAVLPHRARLTWVGLWTHADDAGRCKDSTRLIKGDVWPLDDDVSLEDIETDLRVLARHGRILRYEVDGVRYIQIVNWTAHQAISKPTPSRTPGPSEGRILAIEDDPEPPEVEDGEYPGDYTPSTPEDSSSNLGYSDDYEPSTPESSGSAPGGLPEDSRKAPAWKGEEGKGREGRGGDARVRKPARDDPAHSDSEPPTQNLETINPDEPPPMRCADHVRTLGEIPPCRGCANAKEARREWEAARTMAIAHERSTEARRRAEANRAQIDACGLCDDRGYLDDRLCPHDPGQDGRARRGAAAARALVGERPRPQRGPTPSEVVDEAAARRRAAEAEHQARLAADKEIS